MIFQREREVNIMTDRELLELVVNQVELVATQVANLTSQVTTLTTQVANLTTQADTLTKDVDEIKVTMATKKELNSVKAIVLKIENEHSQKLGALFDGYKLNSEKLDRIEKEVSKHEEIILRRIR